MLNIPRLIISAPHRSAGKTSVSTGLIYAWRQRGFKPQPFKKGADYIDPMWLSAAAKKDCRNLDFHMMSDENILRSFHTASAGAGIAVIEGNMGLFDGMDIEGSDSTGGLAHLLMAPVILVVDASRMNRGIAPLLAGYKTFDPDIKIAGVILNKVGSARHESKLRAAIEKYVGMEILGVVPKAPDEMIARERHLGLIPIKEDPALTWKIATVGEIIERHVDMDRLYELASMAEPLPDVPPCHTNKRPEKLRIGVALDSAFTFYYPENLEALEDAGARIVNFSPIKDKKLPEVNALYIGGGFPEIFMDELESNIEMRTHIKNEIEEGLPVYAECGGLMYLARSINWNGKEKKMVGVLPCDVVMTEKPVGMGYVILEPTGKIGWGLRDTPVHCHEFHHSKLINIGENIEFAWKVIRGAGASNGKDGIIYKNVLASYAHIHHCGAQKWAEEFVDFAKGVGRTANAPAGAGVD